MGRQRTGKQQIDEAAKARTAVKLRLAGHTYDEIAEMAGYADRSGAHRAVSRHLGAVRKETAEDAEQLRQQSIARRESWLAALAPRIDEGDEKAIAVAERTQQALDRLYGIDKPSEVVVEGEGFRVVIPEPRNVGS